MPSSAVAEKTGKRPGVKYNLLERVTDLLFPGFSFLTKNGVGVYTPDMKFRVKRAVSFSTVPLRVASLKIAEGQPQMCDGIFAETLHWGICGKEATTANDATDTEFLLGFRDGKHFVSRVIVKMSKDFTLPIFDTDLGHISMFLDVMVESTVSRAKRKLCRPKIRSRSEPNNEALVRPCLDHPATAELSFGMDPVLCETGTQGGPTQGSSSDPRVSLPSYQSLRPVEQKSFGNPLSLQLSPLLIPTDVSAPHFVSYNLPDEIGETNENLSLLPESEADLLSTVEGDQANEDWLFLQNANEDFPHDYFHF